MNTALEFKIVQQGEWHILQAVGKIDTTNALQAETATADALKAGKKIAFDMSQLEYISSAGLRVLLRTGKKAKKTGKTFVLCGVAGMVKEILEDSGTDMLFEIFDTPENLK